jgi:hypothetical protein
MPQDFMLHNYELQSRKPLARQLKLPETYATDIKFDPCSTNYMLVLFKNGGSALYDTANNLAEVSRLFSTEGSRLFSTARWDAASYLVDDHVAQHM